MANKQPSPNDQRSNVKNLDCTIDKADAWGGVRTRARLGSPEDQGMVLARRNPRLISRKAGLP